MAPSGKYVFWEVDTQRDFMLPGGALYVPGAESLLPNVDRLVEPARRGRVLLVSDACVHTPDDPEFLDFPPHCLQGAAGAKIVPEGLARDVFYIPDDPLFPLPADFLRHQQIVLLKKTLDVFDNPHADSVIAQIGRGVEFIVFGVVTEFCTRCAVRSLLHRKRRVAVVRDAIAVIDPVAGQRTLHEFTAAGVHLISSAQALARLADG